VKTNIEPKAPIDKCPYCGSESGYFTKDYIHGSTYYYHNFDGTGTYNGEMYDSMMHVQGKIAYCIDCGRRLFKMSEIE